MKHLSFVFWWSLPARQTGKLKNARSTLQYTTNGIRRFGMVDHVRTFDKDRKRVLVNYPHTKQNAWLSGKMLAPVCGTRCCENLMVDAVSLTCNIRNHLVLHEALCLFKFLSLTLPSLRHSFLQNC